MAAGPGTAGPARPSRRQPGRSLGDRRSRRSMSDEPEAPTFDESSDGERALSIPSELPILPLRDTVLFPNSFMPLAVARESSVRLIDDAIGGGKLIAVFTQRDATVEEPVAGRPVHASARPRTSTRCSSCRTAACG
ncbi:MAG: LON peptidase substrate-binding domain-containing protein [Candidatus Moduliflexus flocculans]|nr:LON peptidase substrate-binding domain-containing protein [Candidatus Moduliflexus flocculans]